MLLAQKNIFGKDRLLVVAVNTRLEAVGCGFDVPVPVIYSDDDFLFEFFHSVLPFFPSFRDADFLFLVLLLVWAKVAQTT